MRILLITISTFLISNLFSQSHFCYTTEMQNAWFKSHPELKKEFEKLQQQATDEDASNQANGSQQKATAASAYTIPIVFHILHTGGAENISDAQVKDAVNILTRDFNRLNADTANVVVPFKNIIGDAKTTFQLATRDPNGNCTNGIVRYWDSKTNWVGNFSDYIYSWPSQKYLNIYVVKSMNSGAAGYTYLPGSGVPAAADAIVILSNYVGSIGTGAVGLSRAFTHEVGHWLNLPHVWGGTNQPGVACGDDGVSDTPITKGFSSCTINNTNVCNPNIPENIQNYMDYAYCQRMFTSGQATRMNNSINSPTNGRNNLSSVNNLIATGITNPATNCIPDLSINITPSFTVCSGRILSLSSFTHNANPTTYLWNANNGALIGNASTPTTTILFSNTGATTVSCTVSNAFGSNTKALTVNVINGVSQIISGNSESFEAVALPSNWAVLNPSTPSQKWSIFNGAGSLGSKCMYVPGEQLTPNSIEILESPSYDFKNNQGAVFTFKYAYAKQDVNNKDLFKVQGSKDCGGTWTDIYAPSNTSLANNSGGTTGDLFIPASFDWEFYNLSSHPNFNNFVNEQNVRFRFYFQEDVGGTGFGNRFYLDEINFTTPVGINELSKSILLNVSPNPSQGSFNLNFTLSDDANINYEITSITGAVILSKGSKKYEQGTHQLKINLNSSLSAGIYFLNFEMNGVKMNRKLVVE
jgi:hypothetical protein